MRYLVVAATRAEAAHVPSGLDLLVTGVGKVAAAAATARALARAPYDLVVNIGTAGALRDGLTGLFEPGVVLNHDLSAEAIRALGYDPQERLQVGESHVVLATGDVFVTSPQVRADLARRAHLVDMEGYAVAWAARAAGLPARLLKHVSDHADEASTEWPTLVDASARVLGSALSELP